MLKLYVNYDISVSKYNYTANTLIIYNRKMSFNRLTVCRYAVFNAGQNLYLSCILELSVQSKVLFYHLKLPSFKYKLNIKHYQQLLIT